MRTRGTMLPLNPLFGLGVVVLMPDWMMNPSRRPGTSPPVTLTVAAVMFTVPVATVNVALGPTDTAVAAELVVWPGPASNRAVANPWRVRLLSPAAVGREAGRLPETV